MTLDEIFTEASQRGIGFLSITDHDSIDCQARGQILADQHGIQYVTGVELTVTFAHPVHTGGKDISLDFLGYGYDHRNEALVAKLEFLRARREERAREILKRLNSEFEREGLALFTNDDMTAIQAKADGALGRPHIADYLIDKGLVSTRDEAFDRYLVKCNVLKYPLRLEEASGLIRAAGGMLVFAHPNDPSGTSLSKLTSDLEKQTAIIEETMLEYLDGIECWHRRHDPATREHYAHFADRHGLIKTGGSDCHQKPITMGTATIPEPDQVVNQFNRFSEGNRYGS